MTGSAHPSRRLFQGLAVLLAAATLSGCAGVVVGGAVVGGMVAIDRRSAGAQLEDQNIELKGAVRASDAIAGRGHVSLTSYNRTVLLSGEVPTEADRGAVERAVRQVDNVRAVVNELAVMEASSMTTRSSDSVVTGKVKAAFLDATGLQSNAFKVVTERGVVYLMGRVTEREAKQATDVARRVGGVAKVVRVFEIISEDELAKMQATSAK